MDIIKTGNAYDHGKYRTSLTQFEFLSKFFGFRSIKSVKEEHQVFARESPAIDKSQPTSTSWNLIRWLNPLILGWVQYHRHVVSKAVFSNIDHYIFKIVWQWATRRHPNKSAHWIHRTYFHFNKKTTGPTLQKQPTLK